MAALPVDLQINLMPDDSTATADRKLNTYNRQAALLMTAFENGLSSFVIKVANYCRTLI